MKIKSNYLQGIYLTEILDHSAIILFQMIFELFFLQKILMLLKIEACQV